MPTNRFVLSTSFWCSVRILSFASFSSGGMNTKSVDFSSSKSLLLLNFGDEDSNFSCGFLKRCELPNHFLIFLFSNTMILPFSSEYSLKLTYILLIWNKVYLCSPGKTEHMNLSQTTTVKIRSTQIILTIRNKMPLAFSYLEYSEDKVVSLLGGNSMKLDIRFTRQHKVLINGSKLLSCCTLCCSFIPSALLRKLPRITTCNTENDHEAKHYTDLSLLRTNHCRFYQVCI